MTEPRIWQTEQIQIYARRIKQIEQSTDPTLLKSEKLLWELRKEQVEESVDAWREGRPTIESGDPYWRLFRAVGFVPFNFSASADEIAETDRYAEYKAVLDRLEYPEKACERFTLPIAMGISGDLPKPTLQFCSGGTCDGHVIQYETQAATFNIPLFVIDCPLNHEGKPKLSDLDYIADQVGEFIEWAEKKAPGIKYDEGRHIELLEMDAIGEKYRREIWQFIRHVPCPIAPLDGLRKRVMVCSPSCYPNSQKAIDFLRMCRDELGERVVKGECPEERLRILWAGNVPQKKVLNVPKVFLKRKIASPFNMGGPLADIHLMSRPIGEMSEYGIKLSPLQEEARSIYNHLWGGSGKRWVNVTLAVARDLGAEGIIHYNLIGCTSMRGMGSVVAERAEKELGIPTLNMEGRVQDKDYMTEEKFEEILSPFVDKCYDWAGKPRQ